MTERVDLVVVGAGITGLAAAWDARQQGATVVVLEAAERAGGKLRTSPLAGIPLDESADAFLARVPEGLDLCRELGIADELVAPSTGRAYVWSQGALRMLPPEQLLGVPTDLDALAATGILSPKGLAQAQDDLDRSADDLGPEPGADEAVGQLIRRRLGDEVLDRMVGPLIGGIWAGDCDRLSVEVAAPMLAEASRRHPSLIRGAAAIRAASRGGPPPTATPAASGLAPTPGRSGHGHGDPVFLAPRTGMGRLVDVLVEALGDRVRTGRRVVSLEPDRLGGWRLGSADVVADAVVIATPAYAAAPLIAPHCGEAAEVLAAFEHASIALVALAVPTEGIDHPLDGSGFLVPPSEGPLLTACSWTSSKWGHLAGDGSIALLRVSAGRDGDGRAFDLDDEALVRGLLHDLRDTMGLRAEPVATRVSRWPRSFPQPRPGHLARVAAVEAALARDTPGLAVAGAWMRGVGVPACIRGGRRAASALLNMRSSPPR